jgi:hypothetical protein
MSVLNMAKNVFSPFVMTRNFEAYGRRIFYIKLEEYENGLKKIVFNVRKRPKMKKFVEIFFLDFS